MEQVIDIFRFFIISQLLVLIVMLLRSKGNRQESNLTAAFCFALISYLLVDWPLMKGYAIFYVLLFPTLSLPVLFWLVSKSLFDDNFQLKKWMVGILIGFVLLSFIVHQIPNFQWDNIHKNELAILRLFPQTLALLFVILSIMEASRDRAADLVISRLRFRNWFILIAASIIVLTLIAEIAFPQDTVPLTLELLQKVFIFGLTFAFSIQRLEFLPGFFRSVAPPAEATNTLEVDEQVVTDLTDLMEEKKIYLTEGLSIRQLADHLNIKEYKLRQVINQHLGFRNFNEYLNSYRIQEACNILAAPDQKEKTILEIAFHLGYQSLAPFNKAFKKITGTTPTAWRKQNLAKKPPLF